MPLSFTAQINVKDLLKYNYYQNYRSVGGLLFVAFAILSVFLGAVSVHDGQTMGGIGYFLIAAGLLAWTPFKLQLVAPRIYALSPVLQNPLEYTLDDDGITLHTELELDEPTATTDDPQTEKVSWDQIYKVVSTKSNLLIYTNRKNAWIVPLRDISEKYADIRTICQSHLDAHRCRLK